MASKFFEKLFKLLFQCSTIFAEENWTAEYFGSRLKLKRKTPPTKREKLLPTKK